MSKSVWLKYNSPVFRLLYNCPVGDCISTGEIARKFERSPGNINALLKTYEKHGLFVWVGNVGSGNHIWKRTANLYRDTMGRVIPRDESITPKVFSNSFVRTQLKPELKECNEVPGLDKMPEVEEPKREPLEGTIAGYNAVGTQVEATVEALIKEIQATHEYLVKLEEELSFWQEIQRRI